MIAAVNLSLTAFCGEPTNTRLPRGKTQGPRAHVSKIERAALAEYRAGRSIGLYGPNDIDNNLEAVECLR